MNISLTKVDDQTKEEIDFRGLRYGNDEIFRTKFIYRTGTVYKLKVSKTPLKMRKTVNQV